MIPFLTQDHTVFGFTLNMSATSFTVNKGSISMVLLSGSAR